MSGAPKILVVDDSMMIRMTVKRTLTGVDFNVVEAADGQIGLDTAMAAAAEGAPFDLVLTDLNMPNMDGLAMIQQLRATEIYADTPIVMLTTESGEDKKAIGHESGISAWLVKPFQPDALIEMVGGMMF